MFKKTLIKLTALNSIIFILIISIISFSIYAYTQNVLYHSIDKTLQRMVTLVNRPHTPPIRDPRLSMVVWDENHHMIGSSRDMPLTVDNLKQLKPQQLDRIYKKNVDNMSFRYISTKITTSEGSDIAEFIFNVSPEKTLLNTLLTIIIFGLSAGTLLSIIAGYFLAYRSLKPIQSSWEKQQQFVSDASHELRTPLSIIQTRNEMMLQSPQAKVQDKVKDISITLQETRRLSRLVSHLLTLAGSDANRIEVKQDPLLLNETVHQVYDHFSEMAKYEGKDLRLAMSNEPLTIKGDKERIHQLIVILLDNAMKFTDEKGIITITCHLENHWVALTVKDNGVGIASEHLNKIFDRFYRVDKSRTKREGTGLGLSIAQWIVDKHNGKITVDSDIGKGTSFKILFPHYKPVK